MAKFNLKEFDYKQFLLDRGEQVGLGLALTIMVLMLTFTLFWPGRGLFSEGPAKNAGTMLKNAKDLEKALASAQPSEQQLPPKNQQEALIPLDTVPLQAQFYEVEGWYEPAGREIQDRRPPKIYTPEETKVEIARVPVDTYLFNRDFTKIFILKDPEKKRQTAGNQGGGRNPFSLLNPGGMRGGGMMGPMAGGMGGMRGGGGGNPRFLMQQQMRLRSNLNTSFGSVGGDTEYETQLIDLDKWNSNDLTARQVRPCRMAIIAGSFPYKEQVNEFRKKLHLNSTAEVFSDAITDEKGNKSDAFRFLGVEVQRKEVDASGKTIPGKDWYDPDFRASYELWLRYSFLPLQPDDPKYAPVSFKGLVMPRLREFHADAHEGPGGAFPMLGSGPGGKGNPLQPQQNKANQVPEEEVKRNYYKEPEKELTKLNRALAKLEGSQIKNIAAPPNKFKAPKGFDPFDPTAEPPPDENNPPQANNDDKSNDTDKSGGTIPDYCLMRLVDVNINPNTIYRYRIRVRMANPNYNRSDVASAEYKVAKELKSDWYELPETVKVDPETEYYVVDQPKLTPDRSERPQLNSARYRMWDQRNEKRDQVAFQFLRWVESTPLDPRDNDPVPVGDWTVADRVFVARGEFVGRKVKVDIPVWQYTKNAFVLPTGEKNVKEKNRGFVPTGIDVDFGQENPDNETVLVDFEGGRSYHPTIKTEQDTSRVEVLMLSPDGKLLARNSVQDAKDGERIKHRKDVIERIEKIRTGQSKE